MKIQIGEIHMDKVIDQKILPNKTRKYLLPCLKEYGTVFTTKLNNVFKIAVGIGDIIVSNRGVKYERHIFILTDSATASYHFQKFMEWIRDQPMYEDDYVFDNILKSTFHMFILRFPEKFYDSFETFKKGKYSEMFNKETIDAFFQAYPNVKRVFIKDHDYKIYFTEKLNKRYQLNDKHAVKADEYDGELDFPPTEESEVFNTHLKKDIEKQKE